MRTLVRRVGTLLVLAGLLVGTSAVLDPRGSTPLPPIAVDQSASLGLPPTPSAGSPVPISDSVPSTPSREARLPITRVVAPSIGLDVEVVNAPLVQSDGQWTWRVPPFKAGHAEDTAGAGQVGNAVLMGHISSIHSGDVFKNLNRVQVGDQIDVFSGERRFTYRVDDVRSVPRTDLEMVEPTPEPIVSLFTCTGAWDPVAWDFTERLFVRARLVGDVTPSRLAQP